MGNDDTPSNEELANRVDELERLLASLRYAGAPAAAGDIEIDCGVPELPPREMDPGVSVERESLIRNNARK